MNASTDSFSPPTFEEHLNSIPKEDVVYHYTDQAGLLGIVESNAFWATKIQYMNDSTEFNYALTMTKQRLMSRRRSTQSTLEKSQLDQVGTAIDSITDINVFAVCFCEQADLLSQWRGYSGERCGLSIGFRVAKLN